MNQSYETVNVSEGPFIRESVNALEDIAGDRVNQIREAGGSVNGFMHWIL